MASSFLFAATGASGLAGWTGGDEVEAIPAIDPKTLASRFWIEPAAGGVSLGAFRDDADQGWFWFGLSRPTVSEARSDYLLTAILIPWAEAADVWPWHVGRLLAWFLSVQPALEKSRSVAELAAIKLPDWRTFRLQEDERSVSEESIEPLRRFAGALLCSGHVVVRWPAVDWLAFSQVLALFPAGFASSLSFAISDTVYPGRDLRIAICTYHDPTADDPPEDHLQYPSVSLSEADDFYLDEAFSNQNESFLTGVHSACERTFESGWRALWPFNACHDLLQVVALLRAVQEGANGELSTELARLVHDLDTEQARVGFKPQFVKSLQDQDCQRLVARWLRGDDSQLATLDPQLIRDPRLRALHALWSRDSRTLDFAALDQLKSALDSESWHQLMVQEGAVLLSRGETAIRASEILTVCNVVDGLSSKVRQQALLLLLEASENGSRKAGTALLNLLANWPGPQHSRVPEPLISAIESGCTRLLDRCAWALAGQQPISRFQWLARCERACPELPAWTLAADIVGHHGTCDQFCSPEDVGDENRQELSAAVLLVGRLAEIAMSGMPLDCLQRDAVTGERLRWLRSRAAAVFGGHAASIHGWALLAWSGNHPRRLALRQLRRMGATCSVQGITEGFGQCCQENALELREGRYCEIRTSRRGLPPKFGSKQRLAELESTHFAQVPTSSQRI